MVMPEIAGLRSCDAPQYWSRSGLHPRWQEVTPLTVLQRQSAWETYGEMLDSASASSEVGAETEVFLREAEALLRTSAAELLAAAPSQATGAVPAEPTAQPLSPAAELSVAAPSQAIPAVAAEPAVRSPQRGMQQQSARRVEKNRVHAFFAAARTLRQPAPPLPLSVGSAPRNSRERLRRQAAASSLQSAFRRMRARRELLRCMQAIVRLQRGWRCRQARCLRARAQRAAAAKARLARREEEEREKRRRRRQDARGRQQRSAPPQMPASTPVHQDEDAVQQAAITLQLAARRRAVVRIEQRLQEATTRAKLLAKRARRLQERARLAAEAGAAKRLARRQRKAASRIALAVRRWIWRRWRRAALEAQSAQQTVEAADLPAAAQPESGARGAPSLWDSVFAAQSELTARMGVDWAEQCARNIEAVRLRRRQERERREAHEIGMALVHGWREGERELRRQGLRLPLGAGTGGRQQRRAREQRRQAQGGGSAG